MYKPINKLTEKDKLKILAAYRNYAIRNYGMEWDEWANHVIQKEIDIIFDDKNLNQRSTQLPTQLPAQLSTQPSSQLSSQLSSMEYIRALEAREYFKWSEKHEKPNVLDFLIWRDMKRADGTDSSSSTDNSVGMVYVPSKRAELKQSKTATLAKAEKSEKAGKTAKTAETESKTESKTAKTTR